MAWYPAARCRRPNKQGIFQHLLMFIFYLQTFNMVVEIPRFSQAKFEINREWPLNPIRQDVTSVITGNEQRWTFWRQQSTTITTSGSCPTCSRGTDTSAIMGPFLRPGKAHITRLKDWVTGQIKSQNAGPMDGKDRRQGSSWCLWDWHCAKTYWHSLAHQVDFLLDFKCQFFFLFSHQHMSERIHVPRRSILSAFITQYSQVAWSTCHDWWWSNWLEGM